MIVLGADMHKSSHTLAAVVARTGEMLADKAIDVGAGGFAAALDWARSLGDERIWALEDCRHDSGAFERFLLGLRRARRSRCDEADGAAAPRWTEAWQVRFE